MGDLKNGESFIDCVFIADATGAGVGALTPTCTIVKVSTGARATGAVAEISNGWYKCTITPDADGTWLTEWAVVGTYIIYFSYKEFKVGGGKLADIPTTVMRGTDNAALAATALTNTTWTDARAAKIDWLTGTNLLAADIAVPTANATDNVDVVDVVGNKTDAAVITVGADTSLMAYVKGLLGGFAFQTDATLAQATPVQNTWYTILNTTTGVLRLHGIGVRVNTANESLEVCVTVDGITLTQAAVTACTAGTEYYSTRSYATAQTANNGRLAALTSTAGAFFTGGGFMECKSLKVEVRKTTATGTGTLYGRVTYGKFT